MRENLNENILFTTVKMFTEDSRQLLLVVEGEDDHLALKNHCTPDLCMIPGVGGREQVLRSAALASSHNLKGVRFLVDRDYDDYKASPAIYSENVHVSTRHDTFMDLFASDPSLLRRVVDVHTDSARRRKDDEVNSPPVPDPETLVEEALALASHLAAVRIVDARHNFNLEFTRFSFGGLNVNQFDTSAIANIVMERSRFSAEQPVNVVNECVTTHEEIIRQQHLPVGDHDLFSALARVLKKLDIAVSDKNLQRAFMIGLSCDSLRAVDWFEEIQAWCAINSRKGFDCDAVYVIAA